MVYSICSVHVGDRLEYSANLRCEGTSLSCTKKQVPEKAGLGTSWPGNKLARLDQEVPVLVDANTL